MATLDFVEALNRLRRQSAAVSGRQPSAAEVSGVVEAQANTAANRLAQSKQLALQEQQLGLQEQELQQQMELQNRQLEQTAALQAERLSADRASWEARLESERDLQARSLAASRAQFEQNLALQQEQQRIQQQQYASDLAQRQAEQRAQQKAADRAYDQQRLTSGLKTGAIGAAAGAYAGGAALGVGGSALKIMTAGLVNPVTAPLAIIGAGIGFVAGGGSWLCSEVNRRIGLSFTTKKLLFDFRNWMEMHYPKQLKYYLEAGPELVIAINQQEKADPFKVWRRIKSDLIMPVISHVQADRYEDAYDHYKKITIELAAKYQPGTTHEVA